MKYLKTLPIFAICFAGINVTAQQGMPPGSPAKKAPASANAAKPEPSKLTPPQNMPQGANVKNAGRPQIEPKKLAKMKTDRMKEDIKGITSDQEAKLLAINEDYATSMKKLSSSTDKKEISKKSESLRVSKEAKIKQVLTAEQYSQYVKSEKSLHGRGHGAKY